jgi:hypothetical protein
MVIAIIKMGPTNMYISVKGGTISEKSNHLTMGKSADRWLMKHTIVSMKQMVRMMKYSTG